MGGNTPVAARIRRVRTATVQANFSWTYIRVYTAEDGLYGTGEAFFAPGLPQIVRELGAILEGEDAAAVEYLVERMRWAASGAGSLGGLVWNAISGIEAALMDLKGKFFGLPVYQLLGGRIRDSVPIYVDCHGGEALEALDSLLQPVTPRWARGARTESEGARSHAALIEHACERAAQMVQRGYTIMKFDLDTPGSRFDSSTGYALSVSDRDRLVDMAIRLRQTVGPDVGLAFDAHWRYRAGDMIDVAKGLEAMRPLWLEDPVPPHDIDGLRHIRRHTAVPIAVGENLQLRGGYSAVLERAACDIVTPDIQKVGGLIEAKYIAAWAVQKNLAIGVHMIGGPIALAASVHFASTVPNLIACEFHAEEVPFFHELASDTSWLQAGTASPPQRPGLGVELNATAAKRYLLDGSSLF